MGGSEAGPLLKRGLGCGTGIYIPKDDLEVEVLTGLRALLQNIVNPSGLMANVNTEHRRILRG